MSAESAKNKLCLATGAPQNNTLSYLGSGHDMRIWCITGSTQWDVISELTRLVAEGVVFPEDAIHSLHLTSAVDDGHLTFSLDVLYDQAGA